MGSQAIILEDDYQVGQFAPASLGGHPIGNSTSAATADAAKDEGLDEGEDEEERRRLPLPRRSVGKVRERKKRMSRRKRTILMEMTMEKRKARKGNESDVLYAHCVLSCRYQLIN